LLAILRREDLFQVFDDRGFFFDANPLAVFLKRTPVDIFFGDVDILYEIGVILLCPVPRATVRRNGRASHRRRGWSRAGANKPV
jgi:hypothetical protein